MCCSDGLKAIFDGYKVKDAHVVVRKYGPVTGRSKGFGFVDLEDHAEQQKVLHAFNGKNVDGRVCLLTSYKCVTSKTKLRMISYSRKSKSRSPLNQQRATTPKPMRQKLRHDRLYMITNKNLQ